MDYYDYLYMETNKPISNKQYLQMRDAGFMADVLKDADHAFYNRHRDKVLYGKFTNPALASQRRYLERFGIKIPDNATYGDLRKVIRNHAQQEQADTRYFEAIAEQAQETLARKIRRETAKITADVVSPIINNAEFDKLLEMVHSTPDNPKE